MKPWSLPFPSVQKPTASSWSFTPEQLFNGHAAGGSTLSQRIDNVGEDAVMFDEAEVVVDHVGVVAVGPKADGNAVVVDAGDLGLHGTRKFSLW